VSAEPNHTDLVVSIKNGDARSMELLFRRLFPRMCAYARKFLQDSNDAEEVVQEIFYAVWKNRERLDENKSLYHYLFTSVKNGCLNFIETKKQRSWYNDLMSYL
jgi:RNA polymerase sigma-70 factor (ECF subfamily)